VNTNGNNEPHEVFMTIGKAGTDVFAMAEGLGRMVSMYFRSTAHISPEDRIKNVIKELQGIGGGRTLGFGKERVRSLPDAVAKVLRMHFEYLNKQKQSQTSPNGNGNGNVDSAELVSELEQPALLEEDEQPIPLIKTQSQEMHFDICRECGQALLAREEGCAKCYGCGYAEC